MTHTQEKRESTDANPKMTQMLELADKDFETSIITMLKDVKKKKKGSKRMKR